jgi:hypothetical protein
MSLASAITFLWKYAATRKSPLCSNISEMRRYSSKACVLSGYLLIFTYHKEFENTSSALMSRDIKLFRFSSETS